MSFAQSGQIKNTISRQQSLYILFLTNQFQLPVFLRKKARYQNRIFACIYFLILKKTKCLVQEISWNQIKFLCHKLTPSKQNHNQIKFMSERQSSFASSQSKQDEPSVSVCQNLPSAKKSHLSFVVDKVDSQLHFDWNFMQVELSDSFSVRHLLLTILDHEEDEQQLPTIIYSYYKHLKLGDFVKVYDVKTTKKSKWIERTNKQFVWREKNKQKTEDYYEVTKNAILKSNKYDQYLCISIIQNSSIQISQPILINLDSLFEDYKQFCFKVNYFLPEGYPIISTTCSSTPSIRQYDCQSTLIQKKFRQFFAQFIKLRARKVQIYLTCLNAHLTIRLHQQSKWKMLKSNTLKRKLTNLNNYLNYTERVRLCCCTNIKKAEFKVKFVTKLISGEIFEMEKFFSVELQQTSHKFMVPFGHVEEALFHTTGGLFPKNLAIHCQQILLDDKVGKLDQE